MFVAKQPRLRRGCFAVPNLTFSHTFLPPLSIAFSAITDKDDVFKQK